ncbi:hypothetical protein EDC01DRAFT_778136 [Geopyxis carbonaria]|nr:hypothetical protein EDC01DRAFT_778136 [Geopyxis carbonaria]
MTVNIPTKSIPLFGGALTASVPQNFSDAAQFREVPDNQEVWVSMTDDTDISFLVDILQRVEVGDGSDADALRLHWEDIAEDDDREAKLYATEPVVLRQLPGQTAYNLTGTVSTRRHEPAHDPPLFAAILATVLRLPEHKTDIVVTVNVPHLTADAVRAEGTMASPVFAGELSGVRGPLLEAAMQGRQTFLDSLRIEDWGLFAEEP